MCMWPFGALEDACLLVMHSDLKGHDIGSGPNAGGCRNHQYYGASFLI